MSKKRLAVNTSSNMVVTFLKMAIAFIMTPILVKNLGNYDYGMWEIIVSIIGYMGLLDLGLQPSVTRNIAYYSAKDETQSVNEVYSTSFGFMLLLSLLSIIVFFSWAYFNPGSLAEDKGDVQRYQYLLLIVGVQLAFVFPGSVAESTLDGFHKFFLKNNITIFNTIVGNFFVWYLITPENAIIVLAGISAIGISLKYLIYCYFVSRLSKFPMLPRIKNFTFIRLSELIFFGSKSFIQGAVWKIQTTIDPLLIAWILTPASIIFYAIPANLINYFRTIVMTMTQAFLPIFSEMALEPDKTKQHSLYLISSKIVLAFLFPIVIAILIIGSDFIGIWIGPEYGESSKEILIVLTLIAVIAHIDPFANKFLTAENKHGIYAKIMPIAVVINLGVTTLLLDSIGVLGAALGTLVPAVLFSPIYWIYRSKVQSLPLKRYVSYVILPVLLPSIAMTCTMLIFTHFFPVNNYFSLVGSVALGVLSYLSAYILFSINTNEKLLLKNILQKRSAV